MLWGLVLIPKRLVLSLIFTQSYSHWVRRLPNSDSFSQHMHPAMPSPYRRPGLPQSYPLAPGDTFSELIASTPVRDDNQGPHGRSKMEESKRRGRSENNLEVPRKGRDSSDGSDAGSFKGGRNLQDHSVQMSPLKMQIERCTEHPPF